MTVLTQTAAPRAQKTDGGLYDILDLILDRGLVIDVFIRVSVIGIEVLRIDIRIVIASVDTYLRFAAATNRLDLENRGTPVVAPAPAVLAPGLPTAVAYGGQTGCLPGRRGDSRSRRCRHAGAARHRLAVRCHRGRGPGRREPGTKWRWGRHSGRSDRRSVTSSALSLRPSGGLVGSVAPTVAGVVDGGPDSR